VELLGIVVQSLIKLAWNFDLSFAILQCGFLYTDIARPSAVSLNDLKTQKTKAVKNICIQEKFIIWLIFNLGLGSRFPLPNNPALLTS